MVAGAVFGANEAIAIQPLCQSRAAPRAGRRRAVCERYPFVSGAINDVALTPSASAWKFSTTR
jgi:hypothetical protein